MEKMILKAPLDFLHDRRKAGWTLLEDVPLNGDTALELRDFLIGPETRITGDTMLLCAKEFGNLAGQRHAEQLLVQEKEIPKSWQEYDLVFLGTLWGYADGNRCVVVLGWNHYGWGPSWRSLDEVSAACSCRWDKPKRIVCLI